ncbi:condensin complex subunit 1 [Tetranychus urticae]|uniref:Condensin complex subunit 1 n=1 Tax=Tetranychus urticae TaxID=32264 RepID=T1JS03_TETUR|nr:condensin complex subunit 1 [Tetranychus urticae]
MIKFSIPNKLEDLLAVSDARSYIVSQQYSIREINDYLDGFNAKFKLEGPTFILKDFDYIYSGIKNFKTLNSKEKNILLKTLVNILVKFEDDLTHEFQKSRSTVLTDLEEKLRHCNLLKMLIFSVGSLIEIIEGSPLSNKWQQNEHTDVRMSAKKKTEPVINNYERERERSINVIYKLILMPLQLLFQPAVVEEDLIRCISSCCWRLVENQHLHRNKPLMDSVFHIIGYTIEKYSGSLGFCLKIIQLLQHRENLVSILAQLVSSVVKNHNQSLLISEIIREIERIDIKELSRDSSGPKAISSFLSEVAEKCPKEMMNSIANLLPFLEQDSYMMRNATLSIIGTIISENLSQDKMTSREKHLRDELLNKLELHLLDISSYTRGRALQVWSKLCQERKIPLAKLDSLMETVVGRLQDKTTYVRKYAVQFLTYFLSSDIFAIQLDLKVIVDAHDKAQNRLKELLTLKEQLENKGEKLNQSDPLDDWHSIETELLEFLLNSCQAVEEIIENDENDEEQDLENFEDLIDSVKTELDERNFLNVIKLYGLIKANFPDKDIFQNKDQSKKSQEKGVDDNESDSENEKKSEEDKENEADGEALDESSTQESEDVPSNDENVTQKIVLFCKNVFMETYNNKTDFTSEESMRGEISKVIKGGSQADPNTTQSASSQEESLEKILSLIEKQKNLIRYLEDIMKVTRYLKSSVPLVCTLLYSKNIQDVQEAINFLVTAYEFGIKEEAEVGLRKMIILIFSSDGTKKEVIDAYKRILFNAPENSNKTGLEKARSVVKKLIDLVKGSNLDEIISLQELLREIHNSNDLDKHVMQLLWDKFALRSAQTTEEESRICVQLISMLASSNPQLIRKNLDILVSVGLGDRALTDLKLARYTCTALSKAMTNQGRIVTTELPYRLLKNHSVFENISRVVVETFPLIELEGWFPMCEEALKVVFNLAEHPDMIAEDILYGMIRCLMELNQSKSSNSSIASEDGKNLSDKESPSSQHSSKVSSTNLSTSSTAPIMISPKLLARFISCIGSIAMNLLIHLEVNVFTELKTRNAIKEERENRKSLSQTTISMRRKSGRKSMGAGKEEEEEMGLTGVVSAEDAEAEFIASLCNSEIVDPNDRFENLLVRLAKLVIKVASDPQNYPNQQLKTAASLTLAKFMTISEKFCKDNLRLLVTILKKAEDPIIRSNTIIAVGDLCVRFPNLLEPWTSHLYQSLRDECILVRTNALKVISRLILSDMIKVQDQISEIAKLMVDKEDSISSFAKLFFTQLSKKLNAVYNVLPDIISNLSDAKVGIEENDFRTIMRFLFELIDKERHTIGLLEKMCQRFKNTLDERQWVDLAFCLSLLKYSDKSITKLFENFSCFADKVSVASVYELFMLIVANTRKTTGLKNETKQILDEFESKLKQAKNKGVDEAEIEKEDGEEEIEDVEAAKNDEDIAVNEEPEAAE